MTMIYQNGQFKVRKDVHIDIEDRGYQFGDGVYEVIRIYEHRPFMLGEHLVRLERSAHELKLNLSIPLNQLGENLELLIQKNNVNSGIIYLQVTRGVSSRQHGFPSGNVQPEIIAYTKDMARPLDELSKGIRATLVEDVRWLRCDIKSLNLLGNVLAKQEAAEQGSFEAIQHRAGTVTEGSSSNVFIVKGGKLYTHPVTPLILNGITRVKVIELCHELQLEVTEQSFSTDELRKADEVFLTGTTTEVMPVTHIGDEKIGSGEPGPITLKVQQAFEKEIQAVRS